MSLLNANGLSAADVAAVVGNENGNGNGMFGGNNGDALLFLLFILLLLGNNGNQNNGGNGQNWYPSVQSSFDQQALMTGIQGIQNSVFSNQYDMGMSLQNCCCENRLGIANLGAQIAADGCSTRQAFSDSIRDMIMANYQNTQAQIAAMNQGFTAVDNKLCQLEMDGKNDRIADLQRQLEEANDVARYNGLIAAFQSSQDAQTTALERHLAPTPEPAYLVPNPNCCQQAAACGCGF